MTRFWIWVSVLLLGPRCEMGCGKHVYPRDTEWHRKSNCTMAREQSA